jgi:hypothetical protein
MTTHVTVSVNGRYRTTIKQDDKEPVVIEGGDTAPGQHTIYLGHPAAGTFEISEEYIGDEAKTQVS